jgi:hypothetical protein
MEIKEIISLLEKSPEYKEWKKKHKDCYLVHLFKMADDANSDIWQIGFYSNKEDKITTFILEKSKVNVVPEGEIFREEEHKLKELDLSSVKFDYTEALKIAHELHAAQYKKEQIFKTIMILQHMDNQIWNITFVTNSFKTLNIKISAETGQVISHDLQSLIEISR